MKTPSIKICGCLLITAAALFGGASALAAPGDLDLTFGGTGKVTTSMGVRDEPFGDQEAIRSVALQGDGKIVVAGYSYNGRNADFALARYNADGTLDMTFNGTGTVITDLVPSVTDYGDYAQSLVVQSDGKIMVAGESHNGANIDIALVRYNSDGSLDTTFNGTGTVTTDINGSERGRSVAVLSDGKIVVGGYQDAGHGNDDLLLGRYNSDGSLDTSFNGTGIVITDIASGSADNAVSMALQGDGKIVVAGQTYIGSTADFALVRYNANGTLDSTFNGIGKVITAVSSGRDFSYSVALQGDGKIVVAGAADSSGSTGDGAEFALVRYNSDGSLDTTFNGTGIVTTAVGTVPNVGWGVAVQGDGKIVVAGGANSPGDFAVLRYDPDGSLDASFGGPGVVTTDFGGDDSAYAMALQSDGKIVAAGYATIDGKRDFAVARYEGGSLPSVGKVTGGGTINVAGGTASFGFVVQHQTATGPITGNLRYVNHATGANVQSATFTAVAIAGNSATFSGTGTNNGTPCTFSVTVQDNGEPGKTDSFQITVTPPGATEGGMLRSGNIQIHK